MTCYNCGGQLDYHSDDTCHTCLNASAPELKRRKLLRDFNKAEARARRPRTKPKSK